MAETVSIKQRYLIARVQSQIGFIVNPPPNQARQNAPTNKNNKLSILFPQIKKPVTGLWLFYLDIHGAVLRSAAERADAFNRLTCRRCRTRQNTAPAAVAAVRHGLADTAAA